MTSSKMFEGVKINLINSLHVAYLTNVIIKVIAEGNLIRSFTFTIIKLVVFYAGRRQYRTRPSFWS